jgi:hypothetical protein
MHETFLPNINLQNAFTRVFLPYPDSICVNKACAIAVISAVHAISEASGLNSYTPGALK